MLITKWYVQNKSYKCLNNEEIHDELEWLGKETFRAESSALPWRVCMNQREDENVL